jgi:hypothetical protein
MLKRPLALASTMMLALMSTALAAPPKSVGVMTFGGDRTLFVADNRGGAIHAFDLPAATKREAKPFNLKDIAAPVARALNTSADKLRFEDLAVRPGSELAYVSLSIDRGAAAPEPAIVTIDATGAVARVDLSNPTRTAAIVDRPTEAVRVWRDTPLQTLTVTDLHFDEGRLYVAGLSNRSFASTLRVFDYPFDGKASATSIEMYHPVHNQNETRAPVRTLTTAMINGEKTLILAYTCTPLVTVPVSALKDGAHVKGKTIAELGWGSAPIDLVTFDLGGEAHALLLNDSKSADLMPLSAIVEQSGKPGISTPIKWPTEPLAGVRSISVPLGATSQLDNQNPNLLLAMRRDDATGRLQLVSLPKGAYLRISDFVNEYDFPDFEYGPNDPFRAYHRLWRAAEGYPELAR